MTSLRHLDNSIHQPGSLKSQRLKQQFNFANQKMLLVNPPLYYYHIEGGRIRLSGYIV